MAKLLLGSVVGPQGPQGTPGVNGSQGPQGIPGPNEIAATTNVTGLTSGQLLYNNGGKVGSVEIVDNLLSVNPDKPLSANQGKVLKGLIDGNSSAIGQKADKTQVSNPNLLINGDFQVWQRGTSFNLAYPNSYRYVADRWRVESDGGGSAIISKISNGLRVQVSSGAGFAIRQPFEKAYEGLTMTLSMKANGQIVKITGIVSTSVVTSPKITGNLANCYFIITGGILHVGINIYSGTVDIEWLKLELGDIATPFSPKSPAEELAMCQRYYEAIANNKTFAIGCVVNSTTAFFLLNYNVVKRSIPNVSFKHQNGFRITNGTLSEITSNIIRLDGNEYATTLQATISGGLNPNNAVALQRSDLNSAEIYLDAEIY